MAVPWAMSVLLGALTATTGIFISINCDYLADLRFGFCRGLVLADRNLCCGGSDNIDHATERCIMPSAGTDLFQGAQWVPWDDVFYFPFAMVMDCFFSVV
ncbi:unnamed protein product, partial [Polarella glacialis]